MNYDVQYKLTAVFLKSQQDNSHISLFFRLASFILKKCGIWQVSHWVLEYEMAQTLSVELANEKLTGIPVPCAAHSCTEVEISMI